MSDNLEDFDFNIMPRLSTSEIQDLQLDIASWSNENDTGLTFLALPAVSGNPQPEIKLEPSGHLAAEYNENFNMQQYQNSTPIQPALQSTVPSNKDFAGVYNFDLKVACSKMGQQKPQVTYSQKLNKAYINMGHTLPIDFFWKPMMPDLYVRATMLYSSPHDAPNLVMRCNNHKTIKSSDNLEDHNYSDHVLLCKSKEAQYFGSVENNSHLNVIVPLGIAQTGDFSVRVLYEFACKHSCISGMNRRSVECVFTLENVGGEILGRKKIGIRVCSCPKRDMNKEEEHDNKSLHGKRKIKQFAIDDALPVENPKKSKDSGPLDTTYYDLPPIMDKKLYATTVQLVFGLLSGAMVRASPEYQEKLQACLASYERLLNELDKKS